MNRRTLVATTAVALVGGFVAAAVFYDGNEQARRAEGSPPQEELLVRPYSPVLGPEEAAVTIVEFFDPACEACRAFYPVVKDIMAAYPGEVRIVLRYTPFHEGSEEVVRLLETARLQGVFEPVLEAVLQAQPAWAAHGAPRLSKAWSAAAAAGLDVEKARRDMLMPDITAILNRDKADVEAVGVRQTPTFFVDGEPLDEFGAQELADLVARQVEASRSGAGG